MSKRERISHEGEPVVSPSPQTGLLRSRIVGALVALLAGFIASILAVVTMLSLYLALGFPTPVEMFGDFILKHIDVNTFLRLLLQFSPNSKTAPLGLALLGMIAIGTVLGPLYAIISAVLPPANTYRPGRREWLTAAGFALAMTLVGTVLFWDELRQNLYGLPIDWSRPTTILGLLLDFAVYGAALCLLYRALLPKRIDAGQQTQDLRRRQTLAQVGVFVVGVGGGLATLQLLRTYLDNYTKYDGMKYYPPEGRTPPITSNDAHYVVTQNAIDPKTNLALWRLDVTGLIQRSGTYTYDEVRKLPVTERAITLECIANGVGDHLLSTAIWKGVTLRALLDAHGGAQPTAKYVAFHSVDGYTVSLPLAEVLEADALLAWNMNGVEIPERHGYPMRVLIPGRYGEENPKWLTRVELTDHFVQGLYSSQGWYNGPLHTLSRIDTPRSKVPVGQTVEVGGLAFAGNRGIQKVEVSTDGGSTWQTVTLEPALSKDSWVLWKWDWKPQQTGEYTLVVRATDGTGELQTEKNQITVPNGSTGRHKVSVVVV